MKPISNTELAKAAASILINLDDMEHISVTDKIDTEIRSQHARKSTHG